MASICAINFVDPFGATIAQLCGRIGTVGLQMATLS
jgi:hypothetical protein